MEVTSGIVLYGVPLGGGNSVSVVHELGMFVHVYVLAPHSFPELLFLLS